MSSPSEITQLLADWREGNEAALKKLLPLVYGELHRLANAYMRRERQDHTLQTTALVHEAYRCVNFMISRIIGNYVRAG
jgi:ECF sigma factor